MCDLQWTGELGCNKRLSVTSLINPLVVVLKNDNNCKNIPVAAIIATCPGCVCVFPSIQCIFQFI